MHEREAGPDTGVWTRRLVIFLRAMAAGGVATSALEPFIIEIAVVFLAGLFLIQRRGTAGIARKNWKGILNSGNGVLADIHEAEILLQLEREATTTAEDVLRTSETLFDAGALARVDVLQSRNLLLDQQKRHIPRLGEAGPVPA